MWKKTMWCNVFQCVWDFFVCHTHTHTFQSILIFFFYMRQISLSQATWCFHFGSHWFAFFFFFGTEKIVICHHHESEQIDWQIEREWGPVKKKCQLIRCNDTINFHSFFFLSLPFIELILLFHCQLPDFRMMMMMMMIVVIFYTLVSGQFKITTTNDARIHNDNNNNNTLLN